MKKIIFAIGILTLIFSTSCKKSTNAAPNYWSFNGTTYSESGGQGSGAGVIATCLNPLSTVTVEFAGSTLPSSNGIYTITNNTPRGSNQVLIIFENNVATSYISTGGNGSNQTVSVTVSGGKVNISGSGIEVYSGSGSDSAALNFNILQTQ